MRLFSSFAFRVGVLIALIVIASSVTTWYQNIQAQSSHAQIGTNSPLPVFVTNPVGPMSLPDGFVQGSQLEIHNLDHAERGHLDSDREQDIRSLGEPVDRD